MARSRLFRLTLIAITLIWVSIVGCRTPSGQSDTNGFTEPTRVACVGDSITRRYGDESYPAQLGRMLGEGWEVRNYGHDGARVLKNESKSYWGLPELDAAASFQPDVVILMLGTNDAASSDRAREAFVRDYTAMIEYLQSLPSAPRVLICTPPPLMPGYNDARMVNLANEISPWIRSIGREQGLMVIELQTLAPLQNPKLYPDKVHPQAEGSGLIAQAVHDQLVTEIPIKPDR